MKNKMNKKITLIMAILLAILVQTIGITYAKYITTEKGIGQAEVAKWAFKIVKDGEETKSIKLTDTTSSDSLVNGKIAPGTSGQIKIGVDATGSEVDMEYSMKFTNEQNKPNNLVFTYLGSEYSSLSEIGEIIGTIKYDDKIRTRGITIPWKWSFETGTSTNEKETNDNIDTQNANSITEYTFDVIVTGTQSK